MTHEVKPTEVKEENVDKEIRESMIMKSVMTYANSTIIDINISHKCHYILEERGWM